MATPWRNHREHMWTSFRKERARVTPEAAVQTTAPPCCLYLYIHSAKPTEYLPAINKSTCPLIVNNVNKRLRAVSVAFQLFRPTGVVWNQSHRAGLIYHGTCPNTKQCVGRFLVNFEILCMIVFFCVGLEKGIKRREKGTFFGTTVQVERVENLSFTFTSV